MKNKKLIIASASAAIALIAFLVYWFMFRNNKPKQNSAPPPKKTKQPIVWTDDSFPLHLYSSGANVTLLQQALIDKYGNLLPKHGADGKFGNETLNALTSNGFPATIDQATLTQIQES